MTALTLTVVLVVTVTDGYRHESIETAEQVIAAIAARTGSFVPRFIRTPQELESIDLTGARLVMFVNTTGEL